MCVTRLLSHLELALPWLLSTLGFLSLDRRDDDDDDDGDGDGNHNGDDDYDPSQYSVVSTLGSLD